MRKNAIQIELFCEFHKVEIELVYSFVDHGFIDIIKDKEQTFIPSSSIENLERCVRLSRELGVNLAGMEVINNMRLKMLELYKELHDLKSLRNELIKAGRFDNEDDIEEF